MKTHCELCFHHCELDEGRTGLCRARGCRGGKIVPLNYGKLTSLLVPGENDSVREIRELARWPAGVDSDIPLHLSRFFPRYRMTDRPPTPVERVYRLADEARAYLTYVYTGNC